MAALFEIVKLRNYAPVTRTTFVISFLSNAAYTMAGSSNGTR
ncbi:unannotated protein [freshwater metagenome]|uniref:Unannotated protein n=1 Tax=freshwater metagenome TaxID=449393 RepID=A0A6J6FBV7_9ZZZZ